MAQWALDVIRDKGFIAYGNSIFGFLRNGFPLRLVFPIGFVSHPALQGAEQGFVIN